MTELDELLKAKSWPCNYFPCARSILVGECAWKVNLGTKIEIYFKYHFLFEIDFAINSWAKQFFN